MMITIQLQQLSFQAYHGVYEEEKILGNTFLVDVELKYEPAHAMVENLEETINYETVFEIVAATMKIPTPLLETVVSKIARQLQTAFPSLDSGNITITKSNPPVKGWNGNVAVSYAW
jgi:dihydroneopterin aldolase